MPIKGYEPKKTGLPDNLVFYVQSFFLKKKIVWTSTELCDCTVKYVETALASPLLSVGTWFLV